MSGKQGRVCAGCVSCVSSPPLDSQPPEGNVQRRVPAGSHVVLLVPKVSWEPSLNGRAMNEKTSKRPTV